MNGVLLGSSNRKARIFSNGFSGCQQCTFETSFRIVSGTQWKVAILGWSQDKDNQLELRIKKKNNSAKWTLRQRQNGDIIAKNSATLPVITGTPYNVNIVYDGANFRVFVDGTQLLTVVSNAPPQGGIAYEVRSGAAEFGFVCIGVL